MALHAGNFFRRRVFARMLFHEDFRQQMAIRPAMRAVDNHSFVAKENGSGPWDLFVRRKIFGLGNGRVAVMPNQLYRAACFLRGKFKRDF